MTEVGQSCFALFPNPMSAVSSLGLEVLDLCPYLHKFKVTRPVETNTPG